MKTLIHCELIRLWQRKWLWLVVLAAPFLAYTTGKYLLWIDSDISSSVFLIVGLHQNLYLICDIVVATLIAAVYTEEFRDGQLRLLFLRRFTRGQIFFSKLLVIYFTIFVLLILLGVSLGIVGALQFPQEEISQLPLAFRYAIQYYFLAYMSLVGISSLFSFIAMYSKNVTYAIGTCVAYILAVLLLDGLYLKFASLFSGFSYMHDLFAYLLIPYMQYTGLDASLSGASSTNWAIFTILIVHVTLFTWIAYRRFVADDYIH